MEIADPPVAGSPPRSLVKFPSAHRIDPRHDGRPGETMPEVVADDPATWRRGDYNDSTLTLAAEKGRYSLGHVHIVLNLETYGRDGLRWNSFGLENPTPNLGWRWFQTHRLQSLRPGPPKEHSVG